MQSLLQKNFTIFLSTLGQILLTKLINVTLPLNRIFQQQMQTVLREDEFEEAFKSLKRNKAPGYNGSDVSFITSLYELIKNHN